MRRIAVPALVLALALFAPGLSGQEGRIQDSPPGLEALSPGNEVRLTTSEAALQNATYVGYRSESLVLRSDGSSFEVPMRTVRSLRVRNRATWEAAWKLSVIGGAIGAAWTILVSATDCPTPSTCTSDYWPRMGIDAAIGAGSGAVVGAAVGSLLSRWERVFP